MNLSITVSKLINQSSFIQDALSIDIVNITSLSRYLKPTIDKELKKDISIAAIVMTIKRLAPSPLLRLDKSLDYFMNQLGDIIVRSDLVDISFLNSPTLLEKQVSFLQRLKGTNNYFYSFCKGMNETTIILSKSLTDTIKETFIGEKIIIERVDLAAVSVMLPPANLDVHGVYYTLLKQIAWHGINVVEVISTSNEISLIVSKKEVDKVFSIFLQMKNS